MSANITRHAANIINHHDMAGIRLLRLQILQHFLNAGAINHPAGNRII
ncbi:MAG: hypothetical protein V3V30_05000 [Parvularculaceae bacterium]